MIQHSVLYQGMLFHVLQWMFICILKSVIATICRHTSFSSRVQFSLIVKNNILMRKQLHAGELKFICVE
jgi:hypothetical protein